MTALIVTLVLEVLAAVAVAVWLKGRERYSRHASRMAARRTEKGQGGAIEDRIGSRLRVVNQNLPPTKTRAGGCARVIYSAQKQNSRYARLMRGLVDGPEDE